MTRLEKLEYDLGKNLILKDGDGVYVCHRDQATVGVSLSKYLVYVLFYFLDFCFDRFVISVRNRVTGYEVLFPHIHSLVTFLSVALRTRPGPGPCILRLPSYCS